MPAGDGARRAATVVGTATAKRAVRSGLLWGALFGWLIFQEARQFATSFPTAASREQFAATLGSNPGLAAIIGPARRVDTVEGFTAWRVFGLLVIVGAIWGFLIATRLLRAEEDAGRWELFLAGRTTQRLATVQALAGLGAGLVVLWAVTAAFAVVGGAGRDVGFAVSASLFYATAATASAAVFVAVGALAAQLGGTRRQANGLAAAVFAVSYLIRMIADGVAGLGWLRWASPLGWVENLHPLTGSHLLALAPLVLLGAGATGTAVWLAGRRDAGAGVLVRRRPDRDDTRLLGNPVLLAVRLERWVAVSWIAGLGALAVVFGVTAQTAAEGDVGVRGIEEAVARLGGEARGAAASWIGYEFLYLAALVAFAAAGQVAAMRGEEAEGHLDHLLARPVGRWTWGVGRLGVAVGVVVLIGLATGVGGWIGLAVQGSDLGLGPMLQAGVNVVVPALFVLGVGTLLYGLVPRVAVPVLYAVVLWSFVIEIIGSSITTNHWVLDTAVLSHLGPVPASGLDWAAIAWLSLLGGVTAVAGLAAFRRRDLVAA